MKRRRRNERRMVRCLSRGVDVEQCVAKQLGVDDERNGLVSTADGLRCGRSGRGVETSVEAGPMVCRALSQSNELVATTRKQKHEMNSEMERRRHGGARVRGDRATERDEWRATRRRRR